MTRKKAIATKQPYLRFYVENEDISQEMNS